MSLSHSQDVPEMMAHFGAAPSVILNWWRDLPFAAPARLHDPFSWKNACKPQPTSLQISLMGLDMQGLTITHLDIRNTKGQPEMLCCVVSKVRDY